ncbi:MAG TPA: hypothetical protein VK934_03350 [Fimbriimonas sp.]|nr:hypothetical protein [Fimbriimonas sp.]
MKLIEVEGVSGRPGDGPYIILRLTFVDGVCTEASSDSNGCLSSSLAAKTLERLSKGRTADQLLVVDVKTINILVGGGFQEGKGYYADMAVEALGRCLEKVTICS